MSTVRAVNARARRVGSVVRAALPLAAVALVVGGSAGPAELALAAVAALLATAYGGALRRRARVRFRPPARWALALARALPQLAVEAALLAGALARQLAGGSPVAGADDAGRVRPRGVDASTAAVAAAAYPCLTPNTVVRAVGRRGAVSGRRLIDRPGHLLQDDLGRLA